MRRLARHLFTLLSGVSVLLCLASIVLGLLSYRRAYGICWWWDKPEDFGQRRTLLVISGTFGYSNLWLSGEYFINIPKMI
jgi:hypothetical protein